MENTLEKTMSIINENEKIIANILHDIKSPLYSIKIGLQNNLDNELHKDIFETTSEIIEYIEKFLLNYSFKTGKFENKITNCDIKKIVDKKIENYKHILIDKKICIEIILDDKEYKLNTIEPFILSIIGNIISNIAIHGSENKEATIEFCKKNSEIIVNFKNSYEKESNNFCLGLDFCKKLAQIAKIDLKLTKTKDYVNVCLKIPELKTV